MAAQLLQAQAQTSRGETATLAPSRWLVLLLALLLLAQPLLCLAHCQVVASTSHQHAGAQNSPLSFFLCVHPEPSAAHNLLVPAFWPGVLPLVALVFAALRYAARLTTFSGLQALTPAACPPTPPPR